MILDLIYVFATIVVAGVMTLLIKKSPMDDELKQWGKWAVLAVAVIIVMVIVVRLLLRFAPI